MVKLNRVNILSNELARKWQLAYFKDLNKIKKLNGRLPVLDLAYKNNRRLYNLNIKLRDNRDKQAVFEKKDYQKRFLACLEKKTRLRLKIEKADLKKDYQATTASANKILKAGKKSFQKRVRSLKTKAKKKIRAGKKRKVVKRWFKNKFLPAKLKQTKLRASKRKEIVLAKKSFKEGVARAEANFKNQIPINKELAIKKSGDQFNPLLKNIRNSEGQLIKKTFNSTKLIITALINRTKNESSKYRLPTSGVPNINWKQVKTTPSKLGSAKTSLSGRKAIRFKR